MSIRWDGEQLSRSISQFVLMIGIAIVIGLAAIEWLIKWLLARRRTIKVRSVGGTPAESKTES